MRAAVYCRLSRTPEEDGNLQQQEQQGRAALARKGWSEAGVFVDDGRSAWSESADRPAFRELLEAVRRGEVDVVVARHMDQLTRNYTDWGALNGHGVRFADWAGEVYDAFRCGIEVARANAESDRMSERGRAAELRRVEAGRAPRGGRRHFGYHSGTCCPDGCESHAVRDEEAAVVREMARRWLGGETLRALARELTERGVRHTSGREFNYQTLKRVLVSPRVAAVRVHRGEEVPGDWEPILDRELHARLAAADSRRKSHRAAERYLLTGLLVCGRDGCGATVNGHTHRQTQRRRYKCLACGRNGIGADAVERAVWNQALGRTWHRDRRAERQVEEELARVRGERDAARAALEELDDDYWQRRALPKATYARQATALRDRVGELEEEARRLRGERERSSGFWTSLLALTDAYETATAAQRRAVLEGAVRRMVLLPSRTTAPTVDLTRVRVEWSDGETTLASDGWEEHAA
jgi:site-specific DNA recombinase